MTKTISIATDFTRHPAGREKKDGPFNGELFREEFLEPPISRDEKLIIDLDGTRGYGSSFLEEAFGGLVRLGYSPDKLKALIQFHSADESLIEEIWEYIDDAGQ